MGLIQYYQITHQPVNKAICIFIIVPIVFCNLVSIKCIIVLIHICMQRALFNHIRWLNLLQKLYNSEFIFKISSYGI